MSTNVEAIGDYDLIERIAGGSMATVFKARHRESGDVVAVKIFGGELAQNPVLAQRFMQEIRAAKSIKHPHIVRGLDHGLQGDKLFLVMEYIDGQSLGDRIEREGKVPEREATEITVQIAGALHAAHQLGMIHRDVKPDNILLSSNGAAKLTDLGLLKDLGADLDLTRPTKGLGTPNFMAPEQFDNAKNADVRCDVYSLAATLYMAVTGELPFQAKASHLVWKRKVTHDFKTPRKLVPALSERLDKAVCHALSADPDQRPPTCPDFVRELVEGVVLPPPAPSGEEDDGDSLPPAKFDRRVTVRFPSTRKGMCRTVGDDEFCWAGKVQDISAGGLGLVLSRRFEPATVLALDIHATDNRFAHVLLVRVVRVQPHPSNLWSVGCVFARSLNEIEVQDLL